MENHVSYQHKSIYCCGSADDDDDGTGMSAPVVQPRWLGLHPNEDQRVHMMEHLSAKFEGFAGLDLPPQGDADRAVMILNRFTRSLTVMYATHSVLDIVGVPATDLTNKSFYECISEGCLPEAVDVIERAKENDSIALLVFEWVDPRRPEAEARRRQGRAVQDDVVNNEGAGGENRAPALALAEPVPRAGNDNPAPLERPSRPGPDAVRGPYNGRLFIAVVSCTSDGLVVILSRATVDNLRPFFAAPWAPVPYFPPNFDLERYQLDPETRRQRRRPPKPEPEPAVANPEEEEKTEAAIVTKKMISEHDLMDVIRYQAVFAWSLRSLHPGILRYAEEGQENGKKDTPDSIKTKGEYVRHEGETAYLKRGREWEESIQRAEEATGRLAKEKKKRAAEEDVEREDVEREDEEEENGEENEGDVKHYMKRGYVKRRKH